MSNDDLMVLLAGVFLLFVGTFLLTCIGFIANICC